MGMSMTWEEIAQKAAAGRVACDVNVGSAGAVRSEGAEQANGCQMAEREPHILETASALDGLGGLFAPDTEQHRTVKSAVRAMFAADWQVRGAKDAVETLASRLRHAEARIEALTGQIKLAKLALGHAA